MCQCTALAKIQRTSFLTDGRVFGTWDFKWPQETTIDVSFQELRPEHLAGLSGMGAEPAPFGFSPEERALVAQGTSEFGRLTRVVECLARRWLDAQRPASVTFRFDHDNLLPPPPEDDSRSQVRQVDPLRHYDVLVSLAPLPQLRRPKREWRVQVPTEYFLPGSDLGRYAQRADYGVPTTYLGKREQIAGSLSNYFKSAEFWNWCVHEFGHVLGLPHEHQNPKIHAALRSGLLDTPQLVATLQSALGAGAGKPNLKITENEVTEEIASPWPVVRDRTSGQVLYSDFRDYPPGEVPDDNSSIMLHIFWQRLRQGATGAESANFRERPTTSDVEHVRNMYP